MTTLARLAVAGDVIATIVFLLCLYLITRANPSTIASFRVISRLGELTTVFAACFALMALFINKSKKVAVLSLGASIWLFAIFLFFTGGGDPTPLERPNQPHILIPAQN
jgi:hypothetical protein